MYLLEILNNILRTKNQIRDILNENDNIARYYVTMHNVLLEKYNEGYVVGFRERYYTLTGETRKVYSDKRPLPYELDNAYYEEYDPEILLDIMKDVLNYKLHMKDELNEYLDPDIGDEFKDYPDYLNSLLTQAYDLGYSDGVNAADAAYEGTAEIGTITPDFTNNMLSFDKSDEVAVYYKIGANGVETLYVEPFILSYDCTVYYKGKLGLSETAYQQYVCTIDPNGYAAFVSPPLISQDDDRIYITCPSANAAIQYSIDGGQWYTYSGPILKSVNMQNIIAVAIKNYEYSNYSVQPITHAADEVHLENVKCTIADNGSTRTVTLSCDSPNVTIRYAIDQPDNANYYTYEEPVSVSANRFLLYTYAIDGNNNESKIRLVYKFDNSESSGAPQPVQFIEEGGNITLYTVTPGAKVFYALGSSSTYTEANSNAVTLTLNDITYINAYASLNGVDSQVTSYTYNPNGSSSNAKPQKPTITRNGNIILIDSPFEVRYTLDQTDPALYGIIYNKQTGIQMTGYTVIYARAVNSNGVWSDYAKASLKLNESSEGSNDATGGGPVTNGTETDIPFDFNDGKWFNVKGATGLVFTGSRLLFANEGDRFWKASEISGAITGLNPNIKTYFKGSVQNIVSFTGQAVISGDLGSIINGNTGSTDLIYKGIFNGCSGLVNASGLVINITNMPNYMLQNMFANCTDLVEAAFKIDNSIISDGGMQGMFSGCINLIGGPEFEIFEVGLRGMDSAFKNCSKLASTGELSITAAGNYAFQSCFEGCSQLDGVKFRTPRGDSPVAVCANMFKGCSNLSDTSGISLNYEVANSSCYSSMFYECSSMQTPVNLPATDCRYSCYANMYYGCGLTTPPVINATSISEASMLRMFMNCNSLVDGPILNAESIFNCRKCYEEMFKGCSNLMSLQAMFKNNPSNGASTANWLYGVAEGGTFTGNREASWPNEVQRGPSTIPASWNINNAAVIGNITRVWAEDGICYIEHSNPKDKIYYAVSDHRVQGITPADLQLLYDDNTGFKLLYDPTYVYAVCENEDEVRQSVVGEWTLNPGYRDITITQQGNDIYIQNPDDFYYSISYEIWNADKSEILVNSGFNNHNPVYTMTADTVVIAIGYISVNGITTEVKRTERALEYGAASPVIGIAKQYNGNGSAIINWWCEISYPSTTIALKYIINNSEDDDYENWDDYTGIFKITNYFDDNHRVRIRAVAKIAKDNEVCYTWTLVQNANTDDDVTAILYEPILTQISGTNKFRLTYNNQDWSTWDSIERGVNIEYKISLGGPTKQYTGDTNLPLSLTATNYNVYVRARIGNFWTTEHWDGGTPFTMQYDPSQETFDVTAPEIGNEWINDTHQMKITITPTFADASNNYGVNTYVWIEVPADGYDYSGFRPASSDDVYRGYTVVSGPIYVNTHVVKFTVHAKTVITHGNTQDESPISEQYFDILDWWNWEERPAPANISINGRVVTVTVDYYKEVILQFKVESPSWGAGVINPDKYKDYSNEYVTYDAGTNNYKITLDEYLASGTMWFMYTDEGIPSPEVSKSYKNNNVVPLHAPEIWCDWDNDKYAYILKLVYENNPGVILKYRIENCKWSGGVIDEHKYDAERVCGLYGDTISEFLIEGDIVGITIYAPHGANKKIETREHFINEYYTPIQPPTVTVRKASGQSYYNITLKNINTYVINEFRLKPGAEARWDPRQLDKTIYNEWTQVNGSFRLNEYLWAGTFEARSRYGSTEISDTVEKIWDNGRTVNDAAPTINVTPNDEAETYTVEIINNADTNYYPRLKWRFDDIEWNNNSNNTCFPSRYMYIGQDGYIVDGTSSAAIYDGTQIIINVDDTVMSATIVAFATNESGHSTISDRTPYTTVEFTNEFINEE